MKLDHINLTVHNVTEASAFFKRHFGYKDAFPDNHADITVLRGDDSTYINLMKGSNVAYPGLFHIGFDLKTEASVNEMYVRLIDDGIKAKPPKHAWGSWTFHFKCPGGNFNIEVACDSESSG